MADMAETNETMGGAEAPKPSEATTLAWEAQAYMLLYRNSVHGSVQAEEAKHNANQAFDQMTAATYPQLFAWAMRRMDYDAHNVQDVLQEAYAKVYKGLPRFRGDNDVEAWLQKIACHELSNFYSREGKHASRRDLLFDGDIADVVQLGRLSVRHHEDDPLQYVVDQEDQHELQEALDAVSEAIQDLSPKLGRAVVLHHLRGLSHADIAQKLGIIEATSKVRVHRAIQKLRGTQSIQQLQAYFLEKGYSSEK